MLDQDLQDRSVELEVERIELFFLKEHYNTKQKLYYINSKLFNARVNKDELLTKVCNILYERIN